MKSSIKEERSIGSIRKMDPLHRVSVPKDLCDAMGIHPGDKLQVFMRANKDIVFRRCERHVDKNDLIMQAECVNNGGLVKGFLFPHVVPGRKNADWFIMTEDAGECHQIIFNTLKYVEQERDKA